MSHDGLMIGVSGIRGRVGEALTPEVVARYAAGFGAWAASRAASKRVVVGRDSRVSGPLFHRVVLSALSRLDATSSTLVLPRRPHVSSRSSTTTRPVA